MDIEAVPRRERRHFRKYINGEIVYSDVPFGHEEKHNYPLNNEGNKGGNLLNIEGKSSVIKHKDEKIQKVLQNISDIVAPDVDSVAEAIYIQVSKDSQFNDFKKEEIEETIKSSKHYRASKNNEDLEVIETDNLKSLVEDVFSQLEKEENVKETKKEKVKEEPKKEKVKEENKKESNSKEKKNTKKKEEKNEIQDLLDEDSEDFDFDQEDDEDLGLKF